LLFVEAIPITKRNAGFSTSLRFGRNDGFMVDTKEKQISPLRCEMTNLKISENKTYKD